MINEMRDFVLELVQSEYETGHRLAEDKNEFNELCRDEGYRATKAMYDFYEECHNLGPAGFYAEYKDELDFDPMFVSEYGDDADEMDQLTGEDLRVAIDEEIPYIRQNIGENGTLNDAVNDFMLACEEANQSADRSEVEAILADYFDSEGDDNISEALSNKEKLKRAYPELNFDNPVTEPLNESVDAEDKIRTAVGILYDMDNFVLSVYDNGYWLSMGVPDGEFNESDRDLAEANYKEHEWLIEDDGFDSESFKDLLDAFQTATDGSDYDQNERARIIHEAEVILNMNESWEEDEYETDERYFIYDENDNCISNSYRYLDDAIDDAKVADYPVIKIHKYFRDDQNKLQPEGDPEVVWFGGDIVEDNQESESEKILTEAPSNFINNLKNKIAAKKGDIGAAADVAYARESKELPKKIKAIKKLLAADYGDPNNTFYVDGKWINHRERSQAINPNQLNSYIDKIAEIDPNSPEGKLLASAINTVVKNKDSYIIRRGLEKVNTPFNPVRKEQLYIPDQYRAETLVGVKFDGSNNADTAENTSTNKPSDSNTAPEEVAQAEAQAETQVANTPDWINDKSIKAAITLLAKRKNGNANYYDADGNKIDYRTINKDNVNSIFLDKNATQSFISALESVKAGLAKRKAAAIKSAALFGESLDDDYSIEESIPETDLEVSDDI